MKNTKIDISKKIVTAVICTSIVLAVFASLGFLGSVTAHGREISLVFVGCNVAGDTGSVLNAADGTPADGSRVRVYLANFSNEREEPYSEPATLRPGSTYTVEVLAPGGAYQVDVFHQQWRAENEDPTKADVVVVVDQQNIGGEGYTISWKSIIPAGTAGGAIYLDVQRALQKIPTPTFPDGSTISWSAISDPAGNVYGYRVYEAPALVGPWTVIGNPTTNSLTYPLQNNYYYNISVLYRGAASTGSPTVDGTQAAPGVWTLAGAVESQFRGPAAQYTVGVTPTTDYIQIRSVSGGGGSIVTTLSLIPTQTSSLYVACYNNTGGYISDSTVATTTWVSSVPGVATVTSPANPTTVTGVAPGTSTITATNTTSGKTNTTTVNVAAWTVDYIQIRSVSGGGGSIVTTLSLNPTQTSSLYVACYNNTGGYISDSTVATTTWVSSVPGVATVTSPANPTTVTGVAVGTSTITATNTTSGKTNTTTVNVVPTPYTVDYIQIRSVSGGGGSIVTTLSLSPTQTSSLYVACYNNTGGYISDSTVATTTWVSSVPGVATVTSPANPTTVTGVAVGTSTITATNTTSGKTNTTTLNVAAWTVDYIQIRSVSGGGGSIVTTLSLIPTQTSSLYVACYNNTGGYISDSTVATTTWVSSVPGVATVTSPANPTTVTGVAVGTSTITATNTTSGKTNTTTVNVVLGLADITVTYEVPNPVAIGYTYNLSVTLKNTVAEASALITVKFSKSDTSPVGNTGNIGTKTVSLGGFETKTVYSDDFVATGTYYRINISSPSSGDKFNGNPQYWDTENLGIALSSTGVTIPPAPTTSFEPTVIGIGIAVLVVAVLGTVVVWRKKKEKKKIEE